MPKVKSLKRQKEERPIPQHILDKYPPVENETPEEKKIRDQKIRKAKSRYYQRQEIAQQTESESLSGPSSRTRSQTIVQAIETSPPSGRTRSKTKEAVRFRVQEHRASRTIEQIEEDKRKNWEKRKRTIFLGKKICAQNMELKRISIEKKMKNNLVMGRHGWGVERATLPWSVRTFENW